MTRKRIQLSKPTLAQLVPKVKPNRIKIGWNKRFRFGSELSRCCADVTLFVLNFGRIVPSLCQRDSICSKFRQNCADLFGFSAELCRDVPSLTLFVRNFGRIVPTLRLFYAELCRFWDYFSAELCRRCAEFQTIFAQIKLYQICVDLCYFR